eukprot:c4144_g2_i1 orf=271-435(+)
MQNVEYIMRSRGNFNASLARDLGHSLGSWFYYTKDVWGSSSWSYRDIGIGYYRP